MCSFLPSWISIFFQTNVQPEKKHFQQLLHDLGLLLFAFWKKSPKNGRRKYDTVIILIPDIEHEQILVFQRHYWG